MIHEKHKEFAQALVALAREHDMDDLNASFSFAFRNDARRENPGPTQTVSMKWSEGRHGAQSRIVLSAHATVHERDEIQT